MKKKIGVLFERPLKTGFTVFLSLMLDFVFANSADPGEISHYTALYLGLYSLAKYTLRALSLHRFSTKLSEETVLASFIFVVCKQIKSNQDMTLFKAAYSATFIKTD